MTVKELAIKLRDLCIQGKGAKKVFLTQDNIVSYGLKAVRENNQAGFIQLSTHLKDDEKRETITISANDICEVDIKDLMGDKDGNSNT
jgi:hypothetical protein